MGFLGAFFVALASAFVALIILFQFGDPYSLGWTRLAYGGALLIFIIVFASTYKSRKKRVRQQARSSQAYSPIAPRTPAPSRNDILRTLQVVAAIATIIGTIIAILAFLR